MPEDLMGWADPMLAASLGGFLASFKNYVLIFLGFSLVIFFHELGHFLAAKVCNVRVDKFAIGFGREIVGFTRGETRYAFNILPLGGYVKMLGQEDFAIDKSGELKVKEDPRAFTHKPVSQRMFIVSAGVIMNLVFAAVLFMLVFMIGINFPPAEVGLLEMDSPAERAGLQVGDRIVAINEEAIADFADLSAAIKLADPDLSMEVTLERPDPEGGPPSVLNVEVPPEKVRGQNMLRIGVAPVLTATVADVYPDPTVPAEDQPQVGDEIIEVGGEKVSDFFEIFNALLAHRGELAAMKVRRTGQDGQPVVREVKRRVYLAFRPTGEKDEASGHLLGLVPRRRIDIINPGERADLAEPGLKAGDVIARWGDQRAPTIKEILTSIGQNPERDIWVEVLRPLPGGGSRSITTFIRPRVKGILMRGTPKVGMSPFAQETDRLVVADITTHVNDDIPTPTAKLKGVMRRGSRITKVDDQPVASWNDLVERFLERAGREVKIFWQYGEGPEESGTIYVPHSLGTTFDLPPGNIIASIAGESYVEVERNGRHVPYSANNWQGAREILRKHLNETVTVEYHGFLDNEAKTAQIKVSEEMLDTWPMRVTYDLGDIVTSPAMAMVQERNPFKAMMIGVRKTFYFIDQVYLMMKRLIITRSVDVDQISGPVAIVKIGSDVAEQDFVKMLYFLGLISANLAVINFLPLPIVDGGLFVFLIIEKIKGSPISMRVQIATQLIGLALIIGIFLFVTINDIQKLFG